MPAEPQLSTTTDAKSFCMVVSKLPTGLLIDPPTDPLTGPPTGQPPTGRGGTVTAGLELRDQPGLRPTKDPLSISLLKSKKVAQLQTNNCPDKCIAAVDARSYLMTFPVLLNWSPGT